MNLSNDDISKLRDLVGTAVVSVGAAATWLTFWYGRLDKREERLGDNVREVDGLDREIEGIRPWAEPGYDDSSHDEQWFSPTFGVYDVVSTYIDSFSSTPAAHFFGKKLVDAVLDLQAAIRRFRSRVVRHSEFVTGADPAMRARVLVAVQPALQVNGGKGLKLEDVRSLPGLSDEDRAWLHELYRLNKEVHVLGIGKAGESGKLYDARVNAAEAVVKAKGNRGRRVTETVLGIVGHFFATVFSVVGAYLLYLAITSFLAMGSPDSVRPSTRRPETSAAPMPTAPAPAAPVTPGPTAAGEAAVRRAVVAGESADTTHR